MDDTKKMFWARGVLILIGLMLVLVFMFSCKDQEAEDDDGISYWYEINSERGSKCEELNFPRDAFGFRTYVLELDSVEYVVVRQENNSRSVDGGIAIIRHDP